MKEAGERNQRSKINRYNMFIDWKMQRFSYPQIDVQI